MSRLTFRKETIKGRKTPFYQVAGTTDDLGTISFYPQWRQYIYMQYADTIMSHDCLQEVADKLKELNEKRRNKIT